MPDYDAVVVGAGPNGLAAAVTLAQPVLDPTRRHRIPAARQSARAASLESRWTRQRAMALAAERYLEAVALEALIEAQRAYVTSLEARAREARDREEVGRALAADRLRIELALARARQEALRLDLALGTARERLGTAVGAPGPVGPATLPDAAPGALPDVGSLVEQALERRPDLAALAAAQAAQRLEARAVGAEALPRLDGVAAYRWDSATPFADETWLEGAVVVSWRPFAAGARRPRRQAAERESEALAAELAEARREAEDSIRAVRAALETAAAAEAVASRGVEQARETARVEGERFRAGRATASDLLEAENEVHRQRSEEALARVDQWRARVSLALASGELGGERSAEAGRQLQTEADSQEPQGDAAERVEQRQAGLALFQEAERLEPERREGGVAAQEAHEEERPKHGGRVPGVEDGDEETHREAARAVHDQGAEGESDETGAPGQQSVGDPAREAEPEQRAHGPAGGDGQELPDHGSLPEGTGLSRGR